MKTDVRVSDCMTKGVITLAASESVQQAAKAMGKNKIGCVVVLEKGRAVGILTERDIAVKLVAKARDAKKVRVKAIMSRPLKTIKSSSTVEEAAERLNGLGVKRLPVVDDGGKLIGIVTEDDLLRVYPGLLDVMLEEAEIQRFGKNEVFTGACESCGVYSDDLVRSGGKLLCAECVDEEAV